jgi:hypothetical protein
MPTIGEADAERPDGSHYQRRYLAWNQPSARIFVSGRNPGGPKYKVPQGQQCCEVFVLVLWLHRIVDAVPLRIVAPCDRPAPCETAGLDASNHLVGTKSC